MISRIKKFAGRSQRTIILVALLLTVIFVAGSVSVISYRATRPSIQTINYSELYSLAEAGTATSVRIENDSLTVTRTDSTVVQSTVAGESFRQTIVELFRKNHVPVAFASTQPTFAAAALMYSWPVLVIGLFAFIGIFSFYDFYKWEYNYGHNLDPAAPIKVPGMSYQPPLFGYKKLLNFEVLSQPAIAGWFYIAAGAVLVVITIYEIKKSLAK